MGGKDGQHKVRKHFSKRELLTREQLEGRCVSTRLDTKALDSIGCVWGGDRLAIVGLSLKRQLVRGWERGLCNQTP